MGTAVLCALLLDEQLSSDDLQELIADGMGARLAAYLRSRPLQTADCQLVLTVAGLRASVLNLAKQGYLDHSRGIRLGKHGGTRGLQQSAKEAAGSVTGAPPSSSAFPALPTTSRPACATPNGAIANTPWTASAAAAAPGPMPSNFATAPSPASFPGPLSAGPAYSGGGSTAGKLQGAWAQGPLAAMSHKKQAALDERIRGRTPPMPSPVSGSRAAGSPAASVGSSGSAHAGGGGRVGRNGGPRQHKSPAVLGHGHGQVAWQDGPATGAGGYDNSWGNGVSATAGLGSSVAGCSPKIVVNRQQHLPNAAVGPPYHGGQGQGCGGQQVQVQGQSSGKRIVPMPVQQSQQQQVAAGSSALQSPSGGVLGSGVGPPAGPGGPSPSVSRSATNPWGVPPVHTSKQQQQPSQHRQQHQAGIVALAVFSNGAGPELAAKDKAAVDAFDPDPSTPCSSLMASSMAAPDVRTTPSCLLLNQMAAHQNDPTTPVAQIVPAVSDGLLSQPGSVVVDAYRARYTSPPSVTSYPLGRPPAGPGRAGSVAPGALTHVEESPAGVSENARAPGRAVHPWAGDGSGPAHGRQAGLGSSWGPAHDRLARLHAWVLCAGLVPCLQDEVSELLYLLACPPEALLAAEANGSAADTTAAAAVKDCGTTTLGPGVRQSDVHSHLDWPLHVAVQYGCAVLSRCGSLLSGLGHRLLAAVATCAAARLAAPALAAAADAAAQRRERSLARSRAVDALGGQRLQLVGPMLHSGNDVASGKSRSQEQQRRVSNRERCRDMFFAVVRQTAYLINRGVDGGILSEHASGGTPGAVGGSGRGLMTGAAAALGHTSSHLTAAASAAGGTLGSVSVSELLVPLRSQCLDVLQSLHPDNLPFFAELFTGCVLQAAATGESLVEGDLANLASRNPSKFHRLNQRMQQAPGQVLAQHPAQSHQHHQHQSTPSTPWGGRGARTASGYTDGVLSGAGGGGGGRTHGGASGTPGPHINNSSYGGGFSNRAGVGGGSVLPASGSAYGGGSTGGYGALGGGSGGTAGLGSTYVPDGGGGPQPRDTFALSARCAATLQRLSYFPPPQRPYIFFLEATDSQSLVSAVSRHMAGVLQTMLVKALGVSPAETPARRHGQTNDGCPAVGAAPAAAVGPLGDYVVASGTLASYLAYLSVVHGAVRYGVTLPQPSLPSCTLDSAESPDSRTPYSSSSLSVRQPPHPPLDVLQLLRVAEERGVLVHVVPCVAQYLYIITNGNRIAVGAGPDGVQLPQPATADGGDTAGAGVVDAVSVQLPFLQAIGARLRRLLACRAMQPQQPGFCAAALCLRCAAEEALSHVAAAIAAAESATDMTFDGNGGATTAAAAHTSAPDFYDGACPPPRACRGSEAGDRGTGVEGFSNLESEWDARLARALQESDGHVDSRMLEMCCPAIEAASRVLQRAATAAATLLQHHPLAEAANGAGAAAVAAAAAVGSPSAAAAESRPLIPRRVPPAVLVRLGGAGTSGNGAAAAAAIPESIVAVLSAPGPSPLQQALAQALLGQYSTGEHAIPMRDVVSYVTGVLAVNGAAAALELIVPQVASEHLAKLADAVRPVLQERVRRWQEQAGDGAGNGDGMTAATAAEAAMTGSSLPQLPISEAMAAAAALTDTTAAVAISASLEAALPAVRRQLRENALRSLQALLPGTVPEEAVAAAAVLAAQSAEVACLQRLVAHVPSAVRSHIDEQMKHIVREAVREVERQAAEARLAPLPHPSPLVVAEAVTAGASDSDATDTAAVSRRSLQTTACSAAEGKASSVTMGMAVLDIQDAGTHGRDVCAIVDAKPYLTQGTGSTNRNSILVDVSTVMASPGCGNTAAVVGPCPTHTPNSGPVAALSSRDLEVQNSCVDCGASEPVNEEAAEAGRRFSDMLMELARRPNNPPVDEVVQLSVKCIGRAARPSMRSTASSVDVDWLRSSAAVATASAARCLYDAMRSGELDATSLERLLVRCLRAACAMATTGGASISAWGTRLPSAPELAPPILPVSLALAATATELNSSVAIFAFLAEVSLGIIQQNANDSHSWADVVWQPLLAVPLEEVERDSDSEEGTVSSGSELRFGSGLADSITSSTECSSRRPTASAAAAAVASRSASLPPMLANLYHHLAAYARDMESYRMMHTLRLALQRVTMGHLTRLEGSGAGS
ncbi:hypothetical protein Vretimale_19668 [Volvox reticuliferus]|uniref:Uncharacterized protein n=1 Tax=Volvox reticuliferus TaxID=1737510 RepID=A0A8J4M0T3_9CHLO|nr:hypothetical protein Vretimale_19668 [Volvox reticuliferus]